MDDQEVGIGFKKERSPLSDGIRIRQLLRRSYVVHALLFPSAFMVPFAYFWMSAFFGYDSVSTNEIYLKTLMIVVFPILALIIACMYFQEKLNLVKSELNISAENADQDDKVEDPISKTFCWSPCLQQARLGYILQF